VTQLTEHFTLAEMTHSNTAVRKGIPNVAPSNVIKAMTTLCEKVLEPVRAHYGKPVRVFSGYRSPRVNTAVGGAASSQHCLGEAVDFVVPGVSNLAVCQYIMQNLAYDQIIYEFGEGGWVHCSHGPRMRNQELSAKKRGGKTVYIPGLVA